MKTTLDIPHDILNEAIRISGAKTKREAVVRALEEFNRKHRMARLVQKLGHSETYMDFDGLMALRTREKVFKK